MMTLVMVLPLGRLQAGQGPEGQLPALTKEKRENLEAELKPFKEDPYSFMSSTFWHCPFFLGGSKRLPRWFGALI